MKILVPALAIAALMTATSLPGVGVQAQPLPVQPAPVAAQDTPKHAEVDARAILNARLAALKAVAEMTPEQERFWAPLEAAIRDVTRRAAERRDAWNAASPPATFLDVLGRMADAETARGTDLRHFVDVATPFVASLNDAQKRRIPAFLGMTEAVQPSAELWLFEREEG